MSTSDDEFTQQVRKLSLELASICSSQPNEEFKNFVLQKWASENMQVKKV